MRGLIDIHNIEGINKYIFLNMHVSYYIIMIYPGFIRIMAFLTHSRCMAGGVVPK